MQLKHVYYQFRINFHWSDFSRFSCEHFKVSSEKHSKDVYNWKNKETKGQKNGIQELQEVQNENHEVEDSQEKQVAQEILCEAGILNSLAHNTTTNQSSSFSEIFKDTFETLSPV